MSSLLAPSRVSSQETRNERMAYLAISALVAIAMFLAASGYGEPDLVRLKPENGTVDTDTATPVDVDA